MVRRAPLLAFFVALIGAACFVQLDDHPGRTCNEQQPCSPPRECVAGQCYAPNEVDPRGRDGGTDGGAGGGAAGGMTAGGATAGGSTAGGSTAGGATAGGATAGGSTAGGSASQAIWQQPVDGFPAFTLDTGCTAMVASGNGNQLNASVMSALDAEDSASGDVRDGGAVMPALEGAAKGKLQLTGRPTLVGNLPFMELSYTQSTNIHLQLAITPSNQLLVMNQAGTVSDNAVSNTYSIDGGFNAGTYAFEVRWRRGGQRRVWMNSQLIETVSLPAAGAAPMLPDRFRVGIMRLDGDGGMGQSLSVRAWQFGATENAVLGDLP